jgi:hypothetical protein
MPHTQTTQLENLSTAELLALCNALIEQKQNNENEIKRIITFLAKTIGLGVNFTDVQPKI